MSPVCVVLRKPPYGTVDAAEAVRHALGGITEDLPVHLVLLGGGVFAALRNQNTGTTGYASVEEGIRDCIDMGVTVYADGESLREYRVNPADLIDGVVVGNGSVIGEILRESSTTMVF